jgi:toxin ParE1/3/4
LVYSVSVTAAALKDAEEYVVFIREQSNDGDAAANWWNGLLTAIQSLETLPGRCPQISEQGHFAAELRQLIYASHRIIFSIRSKDVLVLRVYHGARKNLKKARMKKR